MDCPRCQNLEQALQIRRAEYSEALASVYYRVNRRLAAYKSVELERARNELEEHRLACGYEVKQHEPAPIRALPFFARQEELPSVSEPTLIGCQRRRDRLQSQPSHSSTH